MGSWDYNPYKWRYNPTHNWYEPTFCASPGHFPPLRFHDAIVEVILRFWRICKLVSAFQQGLSSCMMSTFNITKTGRIRYTIILSAKKKSGIASARKKLHMNTGHGSFWKGFPFNYGGFGVSSHWRSDVQMNQTHLNKLIELVVVFEEVVVWFNLSFWNRERSMILVAFIDLHFSKPTFATSLQHSTQQIATV